VLFTSDASIAEIYAFENEQMYLALKSLGVPAEMVVYPGQFQGFARPSFIRDRYERWLAWWDKYLKPALAPSAESATK